MKITRRQLQRIIREGILDDVFGKKVTSLADVTTVGDFKKLIKYAQSSKRAELGKEAAKEWAKSSLMDEFLGKIPGAATAKNAADALKAMYDLPDESRTGTALDNLDIDDEVAKIVDDPIENAFLKALMGEIEGMPDDAPMDNLNVTKGLANYLEKEFDARTVSGFAESKSKRRTMKITKRQLRRIIREAYDVMNAETGELMHFADDDEYGNPDAPERALKNIMKRLGLTNPDGTFKTAKSSPGYQADRYQQTIDLDAEDWEDVYDEVRGKRARRKSKKRSAELAADRERLNIDNLLNRLGDWAKQAADDYMADNREFPETRIEDIAYDLADAWQFEFKEDERDELLDYFDGDLNDLKIYAAESMG